MIHNNYRYANWLLAVLILALSACSSVVEKPSAQLTQAKAMFQRAQAQYRNSNFRQAELEYTKCIDYCRQDRFQQDDSVMEMLPTAMVQLLNSYQAAGKADECISAFGRLRKMAREKETVLHTYARDIQVIYAYSLSRTDREKEAVKAMDVALRMQLHNATPDKLFRDYAYAAAVYYCVPEENDKVFAYGHKALQQAKLMQKKVGVQWLVALMGSLYQRTGDVYRAIEMYQEGIAIAENTQDTLSMVDLHKSLANFLLSWDMKDEAENHSQISVRLLDSLSVSNPMVATTAYVTRAKVAIAQHQQQQALQYLRLARKESKDMPYNSGPSDVDVMEGSLLLLHPKRFVEGLNMLKKAARHATYGIQASAYLELAKFYIAKGYVKHGEVALDSMYAIYSMPEHPLVDEEACGFAVSHYLNTNNAEKVMQYAKLIDQQKASGQDREMLKKTTRSLVKLETAQKNEQLREQAAKMRHRTLFYIVSILLVLLLLVAAVGVFVKKRKMYKRERRMMGELLDTTQKDLERKTRDNRKIEKMLRVLERPVEEKVKMGVNISEILAEKGEEQFRKFFNRSYPYFLPMLQQKALQALTAKEVVGCMLMALKKDNAEIADMLHVARKSVNMSKYRIRKKFELQEGVTLEDYIVKILEEAKKKQAEEN